MTDAGRTRPEVLDAAERRLLVAWLVEVAGDLGAEDPIEVLVEASDLANWAVGFRLGPPHDARTLVLATALATDPEAVEAIAANALRRAGGARIERWTEPRPEPGTADRMRARRTCERVWRGEWRDDAPVETHDEAREGQEREAEEGRKALRLRLERRRAERPDEADRERRYGLAALARACAEVLALVEGGRHYGLNRVAWSVGQLVGGGLLEEAEATEALVEAGLGLGLSERDARRIVTQALAKGAQKPRGRPEARDD